MESIKKDVLVKTGQNRTTIGKKGGSLKKDFFGIITRVGI